MPKEKKSNKETKKPKKDPDQKKEKKDPNRYNGQFFIVYVGVRIFQSPTSIIQPQPNFCGATINLDNIAVTVVTIVEQMYGR